MRKIIISTAALFALVSCGSATPEATSSGAAEPTPVATDQPDQKPAAKKVAAAKPEANDKPRSFAQCQACHSVDEGGKNGIGPNLWGVFEAKAGEKSDYRYSKAMSDSNLTWDEVTLDDYPTNPRKAVPRTKMSYAGMRQEEKRAELITYLKTLR